MLTESCTLSHTETSDKSGTLPLTGDTFAWRLSCDDLVYTVLTEIIVLLIVILHHLIQSRATASTLDALSPN